MKSQHSPLCAARARTGLLGLAGLCVLTFGCVPLEPLPDDPDENDGGAPTKPATHFEAEEGILFGAVKGEAEGAKGKGMVSFQSEGDFVEFEIPVAEAGTYAFSARYANGSEGGTPLQVVVNSEMMKETLPLEPTGGWEKWDVATWQVPLRKGKNTVRLLAREKRRGPNLDSVTLHKDAATPDAGAPKDADDDKDKIDAQPMKPDAAPTPMDTKPPVEEPKDPPTATPICNGVDVFEKKCVACHEAGGIGPLDLKPDGLFERIMSSKVATGKCVGQDHVSSELDTSGKPTGAFMARLTGTTCGTRMPLGPALSKAEIDCIADWLAANLKK